jgi:hypothetical protein
MGSMTNSTPALHNKPLKFRLDTLKIDQKPEPEPADTQIIQELGVHEAAELRAPCLVVDREERAVQ